MSSTTRRALLGAFTLAPLATAAIAIQPNPSDEASELHRLIAAWRKADADWAQHDELVHQPVLDELQRRVDAIPHLATRAAFEGTDGPVRLRTDSPGAVATALAVCRDRPSWAWQEDYQTVCAELLENVERRERIATSYRKRLRVREIGEESTALCDAGNAAIDQVFELPVSTPEAILIKLALLEDLDGWDFPSWRDAFKADVRRLCGEAQA